MVYIQRSSVPPIVIEELLKKRKSPEWRSIDENDHEKLRNEFDNLECRQDIREWLCKDQHYLCAYCMKRIDPSDTLNVKIEHFIPLSCSKEDVLNPNNFFLVCHGGTRSDLGSNKKRVLCCDSSKGQQQCTLRPDNSILVQKICYSKKGIISYRDPGNTEKEEQYNREINMILRLNGKWNEKTHSSDADTSTELIKGRRDAYEIACNIIRRLDKKHKLSRANLEKEIEKLKASEKYEEFIGTIVFFLERKIRILDSAT